MTYYMSIHCNGCKNIVSILKHVHQSELYRGHQYTIISTTLSRMMDSVVESWNERFLHNFEKGVLEEALDQSITKTTRRL